MKKRNASEKGRNIAEFSGKKKGHGERPSRGKDHRCGRGGRSGSLILGN